MSIKTTLSLILITIIQASTSNKANDSLNFLNRLLDGARASFNQRIQSVEDLIQFQLDLLKKRNNHCFKSEDFENFVKSPFEDPQFLTNPSFLNESQISNWLNNKVILIVKI